MARYSTTVRSPWPAEKAFAYTADLSNFVQWDPGVSSSTLVPGTGPGVGTQYDVKVALTQLRYEILEHDAPRRTVAEAKSTVLGSYDVITVTETATGCDVYYDATLELNGPLRLADPLLGLMFNRIGDKAAGGMVKALEGTKVSST